MATKSAPGATPGATRGYARGKCHGQLGECRTTDFPTRSRGNGGGPGGPTQGAANGPRRATDLGPSVHLISTSLPNPPGPASFVWGNSGKLCFRTTPNTPLNMILDSFFKTINTNICNNHFQTCSSICSLTECAIHANRLIISFLSSGKTLGGWACPWCRCADGA